MLHHWHAAVDKGQSVRTIFVDFSKAFDHVDHNVLIASSEGVEEGQRLTFGFTKFQAHRVNVVVSNL